MLTSARTMAIDDDPVHLKGLVDCLNRQGLTCLPIQFNEEEFGIDPYPDVELILADLHLGGGALTADHWTDFSTIGNLLEDWIKPTGSYSIMLWTMYPEQAPSLQKFLEERLSNVSKPHETVPLAKAKHLDASGNIQNPAALVREITPIINALSPPKAFAAPRPDRNEIRDRLKKLFEKVGNDVGGEQVPPEFPGTETTIEVWMAASLPDHGRTPREILLDGSEDDVLFLERLVNAISTSRACSHPHTVREIVRRRVEALFHRSAGSGLLAADTGYAALDESPRQAFDRWMDCPNPLFGNLSPRAFFEREEIDAEHLKTFSSLLDGIDDGAFS